MNGNLILTSGYIRFLTTIARERVTYEYVMRIVTILSRRIAAILGVSIPTIRVIPGLATAQADSSMMTIRVDPTWTHSLVELHGDAPHSSWAVIAFIVAHEFAHLHLRHRRTGDSRRDRLNELAADELAGWLLYMLGYEFHGAARLIATLTTDDQHPPAAERLAAAYAGYLRAARGGSPVVWHRAA